jgi:hypothetical protein
MATPSNDPATVRFRSLFRIVKRKGGEYCRARREFKYWRVKTPYIIGQPQKKNRSSTKIYRIRGAGAGQKK